MADATPTVDFNQILSNLGNLGTDLLKGLTDNLLSHVTNPQDLDVITRATTTLATLPITTIGADDVAKAEAKSSYDTAIAVLYSYASAEEEEVASVAAKTQASIKKYVDDFLGMALRAGLTALIAV